MNRDLVVQDMGFLAMFISGRPLPPPGHTSLYVLWEPVSRDGRHDSVKLITFPSDSPPQSVTAIIDCHLCGVHYWDGHIDMAGRHDDGVSTASTSLLGPRSFTKDVVAEIMLDLPSALLFDEEMQRSSVEDRGVMLYRFSQQYPPTLPNQAIVNYVMNRLDPDEAATLATAIMLFDEIRGVLGEMFDI